MIHLVSEVLLPCPPGGSEPESDPKGDEDDKKADEKNVDDQADENADEMEVKDKGKSDEEGLKLEDLMMRKDSSDEEKDAEEGKDDVKGSEAEEKDAEAEEDEEVTQVLLTRHCGAYHIMYYFACVCGAACDGLEGSNCVCGYQAVLVVMMAETMAMLVMVMLVMTDVATPPLPRRLCLPANGCAHAHK